MELYNYFFPPPKTQKEIIRENVKFIKKSKRQLERTRKKLENSEDSLKKDIKQTAEKGNIKLTKLKIKGLVRSRKQVLKLYQMEQRLSDTESQLIGVEVTAKMSFAMMSVTKAMYMLSKQCNLPKLQKIMQEFEKQNMMMEEKQDIMDDTLDGVLEEESDEEYEEEMMQKIMDEIGIDTLMTMKPSKIKTNELSDGLNTRINNLKN